MDTLVKERREQSQDNRATKEQCDRHRRAFVAVCSAFGLGATLFPGAVWAQSDGGRASITREMIDSAERLAGLSFSDDEKTSLIGALTTQLRAIVQVRDVSLPNSLPPPFIFDPLLGAKPPRPAPSSGRLSSVEAGRLKLSDDELPFLTVRQLAELIRLRRVSSFDLTRLYLARLKRFDPLLHFVVTLTEDRAIAQARSADREIAAGNYRGPLHGIPWGAKDLLSVKDYPTTWGFQDFKHQQFNEDAIVVQRLDAAGAVLVAKLSLGTLAMGADEWFGGKTRNPWKPEQGAAGSSCGPASAVAAGCVGFAIGSETLDSISAPSARCGATGLRPTFGRIPRTGAMALCWSMDKLGPICRGVEDCALVLSAVNGPDGLDFSTRDVPFVFDATASASNLRVGYLKEEFEGDPAGVGPNQESSAEKLERQRAENAAFDAIRAFGVELTPVSLPPLSWRAMMSIPKAECAAVFDELTRSGHDRLLPNQQHDWPGVFRVSRFIPAVDYLNANRLRTLAIQQFAHLFQSCDVILAPTNSVQVIATNLTGHPAVVVPCGFRSDGTPLSITFLSDLFKEHEALSLASAYQAATGWHLRHPTL